MPQVYVAVYDDRSRILIVRKRIRNSFWHGLVGAPAIVNQAGQWALPGGGIDDEESEFVAAQREFLEETGLDLRTCAGRGEVILVRTPRYIVVGYEVASARLDAIRLAVDNNVQPDPANGNRPAGGAVVDWELASARIVATGELPNYLGVRQAVPFGYRQAVGRAGARRQAVDWYGEIAQELRHY
jgi:8-oxo-dGTP pyrophosphatase MutT (NUDIX family)